MAYAFVHPASGNCCQGILHPTPPRNTATPAKLVSLLPLAKAIKATGNLVESWLGDGTQEEREQKRRAHERMLILAARMETATTMKEWELAAMELDRIEGNENWKTDPISGECALHIVEARARELDEARINCDIKTMLHLVRTALTRDLGGMGNIDLYRHSYIGTKSLVESYIQSAVKTVEAIVEQSARPHSLPADVDTKVLLDSMLQVRQSYGRSALLLSGGATFGMSHIGVIKALYEAETLPRIISGASAGSIVCAVLCASKDSDLPDVIKRFPYGDLGVFAGPQDQALTSLARLLREGNLFDIDNLTRVMKSWLGDMTFQEAYNSTRRICNICVSSAKKYELPGLLNYVTAPNVMIWSAVAASCAVPYVFQAPPILIKDPVTGEHKQFNNLPQQWIDGSLDNDLPIARLSELFNVNHFIVSQVNPHITPFLSKEDRLYPAMAPRQQQKTQDQGGWVSGAINVAIDVAREEADKRLAQLSNSPILPHMFAKVRNVLAQTYSGDINIYPQVRNADLLLLLANPTPNFMVRNCLVGERATWPKLSRIRTRCAIELALDRAVHTLRARFFFTEGQMVGPARQGNQTRDTGVGKGAHPMFGNRGHCSTVNLAPRHSSPVRRRRNSAATIQLLAARHNGAWFDADLTDDESDEEVRFETASWMPATLSHRSRRRRTSTPHHTRTKSSTSLRNLGGSSRGAIALSVPDFEFARPITPPAHPAEAPIPDLDEAVNDYLSVANFIAQARLASPKPEPESDDATLKGDDGDGSDVDPYDEACLGLAEVEPPPTTWKGKERGTR